MLKHISASLKYMYSTWTVQCAVFKGPECRLQVEMVINTGYCVSLVNSCRSYECAFKVVALDKIIKYTSLPLLATLATTTL